MQRALENIEMQRNAGQRGGKCNATEKLISFLVRFSFVFIIFFSLKTMQTKHLIYVYALN